MVNLVRLSLNTYGQSPMNLAVFEPEDMLVNPCEHHGVRV